MQITVQLQPHAALALQGLEATLSDVEELEQQLASLGVTLTPTYPGADDTELASYFTVEAPEEEEALAELLAALRGNAAVEAAYVKPADEPP
jgi:hypothetical protein